MLTSLTCSKCNGHYLFSEQATIDAYVREFRENRIVTFDSVPPEKKNYAILECEAPDCGNRIKVEISSLVGSVTERLADISWKMYINEIAKKSNVGSQELIVNYIQKNFNDLKELYETSNNPLLKVFVAEALRCRKVEPRS